MKTTKFLAIYVAILFLVACSNAANEPTGLYECQGAYKSMDFNKDGSVIVALGFTKLSGTYEAKEKNVAITINGKSIVYDTHPTLGFDVLGNQLAGVCFNKVFFNKLETACKGAENEEEATKCMDTELQKL